MSKTSDEVREMFAQGDHIRDTGLTTPEDVIRYNDIQYGKDTRWQRLDLYRPREAEGQVLPVIVSVHGGGWVYGDKECYQYYCMSLAQRGFAVVNFTYRLAPEFKFPAAIEDSNLVFEWVLNHAKEYGLDTGNIFGVGDSAGAHQLSIYAAVCTNQSYAEFFPFTVPEKLSLKAIALNCGQYDVKFEKGSDELTALLMQDYLPEGGTKAELGLISVSNHITPAFPPAFLMTAPEDFLIHQPAILSTKLMESNVPFVYRFYVSNEYKLGHVFHCNIKLPEAAECNDDECNFFRKYIKAER
nr:alpha/beta hydrolase [uncultured Clostridium sp.]